MLLIKIKLETVWKHGGLQVKMWFANEPLYTPLNMSFWLYLHAFVEQWHGQFVWIHGQLQSASNMTAAGTEGLSAEGC